MSKKAEGFSLRFVLINTGNISRKVLSKVLRSFDKNFERLQEDVVHSAFIKVAENIQKIGDPVCPKTQNYVVTIVENKAIDLYRANKRKNSSLYLDEISGIEVEATRVHGLAACMAKLTPRYRQIILLKYYHGFSCKEIAKQLDITEANAIKLDQRAKNKLLQICREEGVL